MQRILLSLALTCGWANANAAKLAECTVGAVPVDSAKMPGPKDTVFKLKKSVEIRYKGGDGREYHCMLHPRNAVVVPADGSAPWVWGCGNPITSSHDWGKIGYPWTPEMLKGDRGEPGPEGPEGPQGPAGKTPTITQEVNVGPEVAPGRSEVRTDGEIRQTVNVRVPNVEQILRDMKPAEKTVAEKQPVPGGRWYTSKKFWIPVGIGLGVLGGYEIYAHTRKKSEVIRFQPLPPPIKMSAPASFAATFSFRR